MCFTLPLTKIKDLNLSRNPLKNKGIKSVGDALSRGGLCIETLNLQDTEFNYMGASGLYQGIKRNNKIKNLALDDNNLSGKSLNDLTSALWTNSSLLRLSMENCNLGDDGCIYVMDGLERNSFITDLNIKSNNIEH